jgi:rubrerythrin
MKPVVVTKLCDCECGRSFQVDGRSNARRYAPDCPNTKSRQREQMRQGTRRARRAEKEARARRQGAVTVVETAPDHRKVRVCKECGNLPERRPPEGCWRCNMPAGPAAPLTTDLRTIGALAFAGLL